MDYLPFVELDNNYVRGKKKISEIISILYRQKPGVSFSKWYSTSCIKPSAKRLLSLIFSDSLKKK